MEKQPCDDKRKNTLSCPVFQKKGYCYTDVHHTEYPRRDYNSPLEKFHRDLEFNKLEICRALHNSIHATPYVPDKPDKTVMADEIWAGESQRAQTEIELQIAIGQISLERFRPMENGDVA